MSSLYSNHFLNDSEELSFLNGLAEKLNIPIDDNLDKGNSIKKLRNHIYKLNQPLNIKYWNDIEKFHNLYVGQNRQLTKDIKNDILYGAGDEKGNEGNNEAKNHPFGSISATDVNNNKISVKNDDDISFKNTSSHRANDISVHRKDDLHISTTVDDINRKGSYESLGKNLF